MLAPQTLLPGIWLFIYSLGVMLIKLISVSKRGYEKKIGTSFAWFTVIAGIGVSMKMLWRQRWVKTHLPIIHFYVVQSFWNFAQSRVVSLQNFKRCNQWRMLQTKEVWWDLNFRWLIMILEIHYICFCPYRITWSMSTTMIMALSVPDWTRVVQYHTESFEWNQRIL